MSALIFIDNRLVPVNEAVISSQDNGYLFGEGLFETIRAYHGNPFLLSAHLTRLRRGLRQLELPEPPNLIQVPEIIKELLTANHLDHREAAIRIIVSGRAVEPDNPATRFSTLLIKVAELDLNLIGKRQQGIKALLLPWLRDRKHPLLGIKSLNYLENRQALQKCKGQGFDEGIFLNLEKQLCEGTYSNLFLLRGNTLLTPPLEAGLLPGITRAFIIEQAKHLELECRENDLYEKDIETADGALLTSSLMELAPVLQLGEQQFDLETTAALLRRLKECFRNETR
ncbi:MAG: aminotransferase class IV [Deltaproteobacteria bacterium]|nr:aminotransferase class IV [Deltaproteobacteria bacterium]